MKKNRLAISCAICLLMLLTPLTYTAKCQTYVKYQIEINTDNSALWKITSFSDIDAAIDTWTGFQNKALNIVNSAASVTHRNMTVDENSMEINTAISSDSKTTKYTFLWQNFSKIQGNQIIFGDVFQTSNFFNKLYGDAALQISYPATFDFKSATPSPYQIDDSAKTIEWARTQDLVNNQVNVILSSAPTVENNNQSNWQQYTIVGSIIIAVTIVFIGLFAFKRNKNRVKTAILTEKSTIETEEDKILKLLGSSGGNLRQSIIVDQTRFSKAKTSQLLTTLENKGKITRYKEGRDKIVILKETKKGK